MTYDAAFARLAKSKFRSRFHLSEAERNYAASHGLDVIRSHCEDFIRTRLAPPNPPNDGRQTPMRGHPVFVAQHACACCCRDCLAKWWKVPRGTQIPADRQRGIVDFLMAWIERELLAAKLSTRNSKLSPLFTRNSKLETRNFLHSKLETRNSKPTHSKLETRN